MCGIMLAVVRFFEPFVYKTFKLEMYKIFGCSCFKKKNRRHKLIKDEDHSSHTLCQFMNSAMNIEFVYIILIGINNFMEGIGNNNNMESVNTDSV